MYVNKNQGKFHDKIDISINNQRTVKKYTRKICILNI